MAVSEDELAKKTIQEAVWTWAGRILTLVITFGAGFFSAWILWGAGLEGAPALRQKAEQQDATLLDFKNKRVDLEGKLVVLQGRLDECQKNLAKAMSPPPAQ